MYRTFIEWTKESLPVVLQRIQLEAKYFYKEEESVMAEKFSLLREWEILKAINDATGEEQESLLKEWGTQAPLNYVLSFNYNDKHVFDLPPGVPPYKRDEATHTDFQGALVHQVKKLRNCLPNVNLPKLRKEKTFIDILESIPPKSADIVLAMKDKALTDLYPNITKDLVKKVFPSFVS